MADEKNPLLVDATEGVNSVPGNNFITNPTGNSPNRRGRDFSSESVPSQSPRENGADRSTGDAAPGGLVPHVQAPPTRPTGVGSIGNGTKPYRLGGG